MKILLRRASSLARACGERAKALLNQHESESVIKFSAHMDTSANMEEAVTEKLRSQSAKAMQRINDIVELYRAQASLRSLTGAANASAVNALLAERDAFLLPSVRALEQIVANRRYDLDYDRRDAAHDAQEITVKLRGLRERMKTVTSGSMSDTVTVPVLSADHLDSLEEQLATIRQRQIDNSDALAKANLNHEIDLPDDIVMVLRKHKIIA